MITSTPPPAVDDEQFVKFVDPLMVSEVKFVANTPYTTLPFTLVTFMFSNTQLSINRLVLLLWGVVEMEMREEDKEITVLVEICGWIVIFFISAFPLTTEISGV